MPSNDIEKKILRIFDDEPTPLHAVTKMGRFSLPWLVSKIFCNQFGRPLNLFPFQMALLEALWTKKNVIMMGSRGAGKSFMLGLYACLRALLSQGSKIIIVGAGLRQSMNVFNYIIALYNQSPIFQEASGQPKITNIGPYIQIGESRVTALPIGDGEKIRGQRGTHILSDEFSTINEDIFSTVIKPFAAVRADPEESVIIEAFCDRLLNLDCDTNIVNTIRDKRGYGNQVVLAGTASYEFNHFYKYHESYRMIIESRGDVDKMKRALEIRMRFAHENLSAMTREEIEFLASGWKNYAIFSMPYNELPKGFLDDDMVTNDKAQFSAAKFGREYRDIFTKDSEGFIKRSSIYDATPKGVDEFSVELYGDPASEYVMGLDPAQHTDNFGCVILKLIPGASMLVYTTAWNGKDTPTSARKIRDIMSRFNIVRIAMDQGGGGDSVAATLQLTELCREGEIPILPVREQIVDKSLFTVKGLNIMDIVKWSSQWVSIAAHGLDGDIHHNRVLFPSYPNIDLVYEQYALRALRHKRIITDEEKQGIENLVFGTEDKDFRKTNEGVWDNIEMTIDETCAIERDVTPVGVERFVLPDTGSKEEGMDIRRRDRFSALVLAAYAARVYRNVGNRPKLPAGGSPSAILSRRNKNRKRVVRRGNVMY